MSVDSAKIKELREMTSAGLLDCKKTLEETNGDIEKAAHLLRERGVIKAVKKMDRDASEGMFFSYVHHNGKIGVMVELNCETDFVAKTDDFKQLGKDIAMHIAAANPQYLNAEDVPEDAIAEEKEVQRKALLDEGKPYNVVDKIIEGKIKKFTSEISLMNQGFVKEPKKSIDDLTKEYISKLGENISIGRFIRYAK